jgi:membrane protein required for colicin V production
MNWLDIIIAIVLIISMFIGLKVGLVKTVLSFIGLIVGVFLAGHYYLTLSDFLSFLPDTAGRVVAYFLIIIVVMILISLLSVLLDKLLSAIMLGWLNHLGGMLFGLLLAAVFWGAILAVWVKYVGGYNIIGNSILASFLVDRFPLVLALLPDEFNTIRSFFK